MYRIRDARSVAVAVAATWLGLSLVVGACSKAAPYGDDLMRAAQGAMRELGIVGKSADDVAAAARRLTDSETEAIALLRSLVPPPRTLAARIDESVARISERLGLDAAEQAAVREIIVGATCESIGDLGVGESPNIVDALVGATLSHFSERAAAEDLAATVDDIWADVQQGNVLGLSMIASVTICSELG
jgi:hypothetical protein